MSRAALEGRRQESSSILRCVARARTGRQPSGTKTHAPPRHAPDQCCSQLLRERPAAWAASTTAPTGAPERFLAGPV
jgi:hypothetical protein